MARARSSAGEHYVDIVGVTGSIPVAPTTHIGAPYRLPTKSRPTGRDCVVRCGAERRGGRAARDPRRAEAALGHSVVIVALGAEPLLLLPDSLLLLPLMKFPPTTPATAVLLANRELLVNATVPPATVTLAPTLLLISTELARFTTPPPPVAAIPLPAANMSESLTVAMPPPPASTPLVPTRETFTRSAARAAIPTVDAVLMPAPPILLILVSLTSTEPAAPRATSMPRVVKP